MSPIIIAKRPRRGIIPDRRRGGAIGLRTISGARIGLGAWLTILALFCAAPAMACTTSSAAAEIGTYSPSAVKANVVPAVRSRAGLQCGFALLKLLGSDYVRAKFTSDNAFQLLRTGGGSVAYKASADAAGQYVATQGGTIDYAQNNLLDLLGLLGNSSADLPIFVKPAETGFPPPGIYKDRITIAWSWNICQGLGLAGACLLGRSDKGTGTSVIDVTLTVTPVDAVVTTQSTTTWDPVNTTSRPKAIPSSRRAVSVMVRNPDIAPLGDGYVDLIVATPPGTFVALDGDGASTGAAITLIDGSPASSMTLRYTTAGDPSDDVDFSADAGQTWGYGPVAGDGASQRAVTHVRLRTRGTMVAGSTFSVRVPYVVR